MKVGVTGGSGFIGSWVVDELRTRGHEPVIFDHRGRIRADCEVILGDITDEASVHELAGRVDGIIHLAAVLGTQETIQNPRPAVKVNVIGGLNVAEACRLHGVPAANICVGNWFMRNTYASTKHLAERMFEQYNTEHGTRINNVRVVNAYGPRQAAAPPFGSSKVRKIMPAFICRALSGLPLEVYGDGSQVSDCVWVGDVARVLVTALERAAQGAVWPDPVEVGPEDHATVLEVAEAVRRQVSLHLGTDTPVPIAHLPMRPGEPERARVVADTSKLGRVGESPATLLPLTEGVAETVVWFAANEGVVWRRPVG